MKTRSWPDDMPGCRKGLTVIGLFLAIILAIVLTACGHYNESNSYNKHPPSNTYWKGVDTRIATPQFYPTIMRICLPNQVAIYENPDDTSSMWILHPDPNCPK